MLYARFLKPPNQVNENGNDEMKHFFSISYLKHHGGIVHVCVHQVEKGEGLH